MNTNLPAIEPVTDKLYGIDEEYLSFETEYEALDALYADMRLGVGASYYSADAVPADLAKYINEGVDRLLEDADEAIAEDLGLEDPVFVVGLAAMTELRTLLKEWTNKHITTRYWRCENVREHKVTAEQVAEIEKENGGE